MLDLTFRDLKTLAVQILAASLDSVYDCPRQS